MDIADDSWKHNIIRDNGPHPRDDPVCKKTMQAQDGDPAISGVIDRFAPLNIDFRNYAWYHVYMCVCVCVCMLDMRVHANSK